MKRPDKLHNFARNRNQGFSLIEILVAMLILAVGVLGIAALQFKGLQYSGESHFRSQISNLTSDIADRMRINRTNAASYVYSGTVTGTKPSCTESTGATAANDLACWRAMVFDSLPPTSKIQIASAGGGMYTITLGWPDRETASTTDTHDISYTFQP